jgi:hypothetical protein
MPKGIIVKSEDGVLSVNNISKWDSDMKTQQGLSLLPHYIEKFELEEHDVVEYSNSGRLFDFIKIEYKILN